ncbi:hypothetical protein [Sphingobium lignivorans]|uniref:Uncharacterized protein n=1 Tax=Sphingobium lignivorans TaxID=2735886 RepID=A0ABR6NDX7_9SPHN|nr:hypothetical protein [Sphingobium lignivorans]MBB5985488.1 hypothetical protein [Sphingobium lignivorans]
MIGIARAGATRDPAWGDATLDAAATDPLLQRFIIYLHTRRPLGPREIDRFIVALERGASPEHLSALMFGGVTAAIPAEDLSRLLRRLIAHPDGVAAASQILQMRFFGDKQKERDYAPELVEVARLILIDPRSYDTQRRRSDRELSQLAKIVLRTEQGAATAVAIARHLRGLKRVEAMDEFDDLGRALLDAFPRIVLDELVLGTTVRARRRGLLDLLLGGVLGDRDGSGEDKRPSIDVDLIRSWVAEDPQTRATRLAELIPYTSSLDAGGLAWSDAARALIDLAPDPLPILAAFEDRFFSGVSSGPFSGRYVRRLPMVASLKDHFDPRVRHWAREAEVRLHRSIEHWDTFDREDGSRFE